MGFFHKRVLLFLRLSLGICFLWFGILKLFNSSTFLLSIHKAFPAIAQFQLFTFIIAIVEIAIGTAYITNKFVKIISFVMIFLTLVVSIPVFVSQGFDPRFPVLSVVGEDVLKNLILISGGLVLISEKEEKVIVIEKSPDTKPSKIN